MNTNTLEVIQACTRQSLSGEMAFLTVVQQLRAIGVEFYQADLLRLEKTYYFADGASHRESMAFSGPAIAGDFSAGAVQVAIRLSQQGAILYPEFLQRVVLRGLAPAGEVRFAPAFGA